jgi:hypothetical protein
MSFDVGRVKKLDGGAVPVQVNGEKVRLYPVEGGKNEVKAVLAFEALPALPVAVGVGSIQIPTVKRIYTEQSGTYETLGSLFIPPKDPCLDLAPVPSFGSFACK